MPEVTISMSHSPSRRDLLSGSVAALASAGALASSPSAAAPHVDAALIQLCKDHIAYMNAFNADPYGDEDSPSWLDYDRTLHEINAATPQTMEGVFAIARAAMVHATWPDGSIKPEATIAHVWAWNIMNDIARIHGVKL